MKKLFYLIIFTFILTSCREERILDFIINDELILVVDAKLTDLNETHFVRLSEATSYYEIGKGDQASGAIVTINGVLLNEDSIGVYSTPAGFQAVPNQSYTLEINYKGNTYTATGFMNPVPVLDSINISKNLDIPEFVGIQLYDVFVNHFEDQSRKDIYAFDVFIDSVLISKDISDKTFFEDDFLDEGYLSYPVQAFSDLDAEFDKPLEIMIEMRALNKETFKFYTDFQNQTTGANNPFFAPPPANISTNLSAGAVGFFEVSSVARASTIFTPPGL